MQLNIAGLVDDLSADRITSGIEVFGDRGLTVGHHGHASEFLGVNKESWPSLPSNRRTVVGVSLTIYARAKSDLTQKLDGAGLQNASANSSQHMGAALPFQHDG